MDKLQTKQELLAKLTALTSVPDDNNIYLKEKVKKALLKSPELLYAFHNLDLEDTELFNPDGTINYDGRLDHVTMEKKGISTLISIYLIHKIKLDIIFVLKLNSQTFQSTTKSCVI